MKIMITRLIFVTIVSSGCCWQFFTSFSDWRMITSPVEEYIHSEYYYGKCFKVQGGVYYAHTHFDRLQILGKLIVRAWINLPRIPTCIMLRALSGRYELLRYTSWPFQVCVPRITYCHSHVRHKYHFLEWYIPMNYTGGVDWDVYFFGPPTMIW